MADDIDEQVTAHIREILRLVLDVKGKTLRKLNELVGQTIQNYHVETGQGETSSLPICVEFKHLRRSSRLPPTKRNYGKMQGSNTGTSRLAKKPKLADDNTLPTDGLFKEPATDGSTSEIPTEPASERPIEHRSETPTNTSATGTPATREPIIDKLSADCPDTAETLGSSGTDDLPTSATYIQIEGDKTMDGMSPTTHRAGYDILNEFFGQPAMGPGPVTNVEEAGKQRDELLEHTVRSNTPAALDAPHHSPSPRINALSSKASDILDPDLFIASAAASESGSSGSSEPESLSTDLTSYTPSETHIQSDLASGVQHAAFAKRSILDDTAPWFEHVSTALETADTSRRPGLFAVTLQTLGTLRTEPLLKI